MEQSKPAEHPFGAWVYEAMPLIALTTSAMAFILYRKWRKTQLSKGCKTFQPTTKDEHRKVIEFTPIGQEKLQRQDDRQASRARPNKRLEIVFGIANAFTTRETRIHAEFVNSAKQKMQAAIKIDGKTWKDKDGDWSMLRELARDSVDQHLSQSAAKLRIVDLVRVVTLKVSLRFLFGASDNAVSSEHSMEHLILIGQSINDLWIASKDNAKPLPDWSSKSNSFIHESLMAVCRSEHPDQADEIDPLRPEINPMNWLLPAYETTWRIVLACVIELRFRNAENANTWWKILEEYISDTSREKFKGLPTTPGVREFCAQDIVKEILRLYPPTRHVKRRFTEDGEDVKADIESCHRNNAQDAFGFDSLCFRPERWLEIRAHLGPGKTDKDIKIVEEERGFMPFAIFCPAGQGATQGFGLKMIALLAGVLCERLGESMGWDLQEKEIYQDLTKPLPSDRAAFDNLYLIKKI